jgi:hypothetical protein
VIAESRPFDAKAAMGRLCLAVAQAPEEHRAAVPGWQQPGDLPAGRWWSLDGAIHLGRHRNLRGDLDVPLLILLAWNLVVANPPCH